LGGIGIDAYPTKVLDEFRRKGLVTTEDRKTGRERDLPPWELQMLAGVGDDRANHQSWEFLKEKLKAAGEKPDEYILAAKRVIEKKTGKEMVLVTYVIGGTHWDGTLLTEAWRQYGLYHIPVWVKKPNPKTFRFEETDQIASSIPVYQFEFQGPKTKIESPISGKMISITDLFREDTKFHIITDNGTKLKVSK
jgi:hypothetical protein